MGMGNVPMLIEETRKLPRTARGSFSVPAPTNMHAIGFVEALATSSLRIHHHLAAAKLLLPLIVPPSSTSHDHCEQDRRLDDATMIICNTRQVSSPPRQDIPVRTFPLVVFRPRRTTSVAQQCFGWT